MRQWVSRCSDSTAYTVLPLTACVRPAQGDCTAYSGEGRNGRATSTNQDLASQNGILLQAAPLCAVRYQHVHRITHTGRRGPVCKRTICWFFFFLHSYFVAEPYRSILACLHVSVLRCMSITVQGKTCTDTDKFPVQDLPTQPKTSFRHCYKRESKANPIVKG